MTKVDLLNDTLATKVISIAIGEEYNLINRMNLGENRPLEVQFIVNGVELDFSKVIRVMDDEYDRQVEIQAGRILLNKHRDILEKLGNVREYIEDLFPQHDNDYE